MDKAFKPALRIKAERGFLSQRLDQQACRGLLRNLPSVKEKIDFCSNDYLGFASNTILHQRVLEALLQSPQTILGATGSRLISGNCDFAEALEKKIATFHHAGSALIFNSGYQANLGIFSAVAREGDSIITDEYVHASIIDGVRLSKAKRFIFKHNDLNDLKAKLKLAKGNTFIGIEALYSMEGDFAPLEEILHLALEFGAHLIVDEAHSTGICGPGGKGLVVEKGLEQAVFARVHTFGKALGSHGAAVLGSEMLRNYLINFARPFIFTTALPFASLIGLDTAYDFLIEKDAYQDTLEKRIRYFHYKAESVNGWETSQNPSCIQFIRGQSRDAAIRLSEALWEAGIWAKAILSPTVPPGKEGLRIILHSFNTEKEIDLLFSTLSKLSS